MVGPRERRAFCAARTPRHLPRRRHIAILHRSGFLHPPPLALRVSPSVTPALFPLTRVSWRSTGRAPTGCRGRRWPASAPTCRSLAAWPPLWAPPLSCGSIAVRLVRLFCPCGWFMSTPRSFTATARRRWGAEGVTPSGSVGDPRWVETRVHRASFLLGVSSRNVLDIVQGAVWVVRR